MDTTIAARARAYTQMMKYYRVRVHSLSDKRTDAVKRLRDGGASWVEIAACLGVSPQAVMKMANRKVDA
jgi:predicted transcriptional regulator